ncbi:MAG: hypothetical protein E3J43_07695 [Candidatus Heimdallarchaeota archaeon]|nr:MAG: hypothetical protein E3J43_07695 [Candidatus Heimdallarchaeota archaeon]
MLKKRFVHTTITYALLTVLSVSLTLPGSAAIVRDWYEDDVYVFGMVFKGEIIFTSLTEDLSTKYESIDESERMYTITNIFESTKEVEVEAKYDYGYETTLTFHFDADSISTYYANTFFYHNYRWDEENSRIVLTSFNADLGIIKYFVEPDWELFNTNLEALGDRTQVVDTVTHDSSTYEITLGDFLDAIPSYKIMGISDTKQTPFSISNSSTKWSMTFDLSNYMYESEWDYIEETYSYFPYSKYIVNVALDYSNGGTLIAYDYTLSYEVTTDESIIKGEEEYRIRKGGSSAIRAPYNFSYALLSFLIVPTVILYNKKKRNRLN